ncbi:MAG: restriction endonuclease [Alphaproteobacteria bacterium]
MKKLETKNIEEWSDQDLEDEISRIQSVIKDWAVSKDLWFDCGFKSYLEHVNGEPSSPPVVTILWSEGDFRRFVFDGIDGLDTEFFDLLEDHGYCFENTDGVTAEIYPNDEALSKKFEEYFHWQWVCSLVKEDTADVYDELYSHFVTNPDDLHKLHWREFETLLFRIFQNHGFKAILGPGRGDEGVDIQLWQEDPLGDILTVVQAKKYAENLSINHTEVAALFGVKHDKEADKALFVTTSKYAPVAKRFAARHSNVMQLAEKEHIIDWCSKATAGVIADKSSLLSPKSIETIVDRLSREPDHRIVHASWGYDMIHNDFAVVVKESKHAALLMGLTNQTVTDDGYGQMGTEIPILDPSLSKSLLSSDNVWRAKRSEENGRISYWDGRRLFWVWDKQPMNFNYMN